MLCSSSSSSSSSSSPYFVTGWAVLISGDMIHMIFFGGGGGGGKVSKFKISETRADSWMCPNPHKYCMDYFSETTGWIVLVNTYYC